MDNSVTIKGWVARDKDECIYLYLEQPERYMEDMSWVSDITYLWIPKDSFPDLKWENDPLKCKITIEEI